MSHAHWLRQHRAIRRAAGLCIQCGLRPSVCGGRCTLHAEQQRQVTKRWMRRAHGSVPQYLYHRANMDQPVQFATASNAICYDEYWGRIVRGLIDWRDPLLILMAKEAMGLFHFMGPSPLTTPRGAYV